MPRLPALERCLARADRRRLAAGDWRGWLHQRLGASPPQLAGRSGQWLATPVHYVAGLDTLRLHGDGLLRLPGSMQQRLAEDFARTFDGSGWRLQPTDARELLLQGPALQAEAPDPAAFLGQSTREALPRGSGMDVLRRLQTEIEMWLHGLDYRADTGTAWLKVNGLWLWGRAYAGLPVDPSADVGSRPRAGVTQLYADDLAARGSAAAAGLLHAALPGRWPDELRRGADLYVVLNLRGTNVTTQLEAIEQDWIGPALDALAAGRVATLELVCGAQHWTLEAASRWRFWRRRTHWLPELLAC